MFALMGAFALAIPANVTATSPTCPPSCSIEVQVSPSVLTTTGQTVTISLAFGAAAPGESEPVSAIQVCEPGTASAPCPAGSTVYSYTGTLPTFTCTTGDLCAGTFVVTYPSSTPGVCSITYGSGICTPTSPAACSPSSCWTTGANTNSESSYGVLVLYKSNVATGQLSADSGFGVPQFGASILVVSGASLVGLMLLRRKLVTPSPV
jgi:hypothetical protein